MRCIFRCYGYYFECLLILKWITHVHRMSFRHTHPAQMQKLYGHFFPFYLLLCLLVFDILSNTLLCTVRRSFRALFLSFVYLNSVFVTHSIYVPSIFSVIRRYFCCTVYWMRHLHRHFLYKLQAFSQKRTKRDVSVFCIYA